MAAAVGQTFGIKKILFLFSFSYEQRASLYLRSDISYLNQMSIGSVEN